ncbi:MAG: LPS assembly protein LptD [Holosporaceae bacterium]|jgi:LPS-assembly protein|nr:LPS assembly protein LptD [Holosporaceae bacterium]
MRKKILISFFLFFHGVSDVCGDDITFINSDQTLYEKNKISCRGNVVVAYYGAIVSADEISFDKTQDIITANGHIILKDKKNNIYFMDSLQMHRNFSSGSAENIKIIMQDKSRLAASDCSIKDGKLLLHNVIYTPCYECCGSSQELTWQIKSSQVTFDPDGLVEYNDAKFELLGNVICYMPYLSHPSPRVKKKSGILAPQFSTSSKNGFCILPKYLCSISESQELVLKPIITSKIGCVGWMYYGHRLKNGELSIDASITDTKSVKNYDANDEKTIKKINASGYRGHIFSKLKYEINDTWRCSWDINLTSDYYYLKRFPFLEQPNRILESNAKLEGFDGRNYTQIKTAIFQEDPTIDSTMQKVLPIIERNFSDTLFGGTFNIDAMFLNLYFCNARVAQKIITNLSWAKSFLLSNGHIIDVKGITSFKGINISERRCSSYDSALRIIPQVSIIWKWPLVIASDFAEIIATPMIGVICASNKRYHDLFEDPFCEINDINFLDGSKSISPYNVDPGSRICYGTKFSAYKNGDALGYVIVGRSTELTKNSEQMDVSGLKHKNSNIVSSAEIFLTDITSLYFNSSYSTQDKKFLKIETGIKFSQERFEGDLFLFDGKQCFYNPFLRNYKDEDESDITKKYRGLMLAAEWKASDKWKLSSELVLGHEENKLIRHNVGLKYKNECSELEIVLERTNYSGGDLRPETSLRVVVHLKNIGI